MNDELDRMAWDQFIANNVQMCVSKLNECFENPSALNDPVALKKIRVLARRTLAAMCLTPQSAYSGKITKQIKEIRELIDTLGAVRDLDVAKELVLARASLLDEEEADSIIQHLVSSENNRNICEQKLKQIFKRTIDKHLLRRINLAFEELKYKHGTSEYEN